MSAGPTTQPRWSNGPRSSSWPAASPATDRPLLVDWRQGRDDFGQLLGAYHEAEDVVQDTYVRALRGWETFEGRSSLR